MKTLMTILTTLMILVTTSEAQYTYPTYQYVYLPTTHIAPPYYTQCVPNYPTRCYYKYTPVEITVPVPYTRVVERNGTVYYETEYYYERRRTTIREVVCY